MTLPKIDEWIQEVEARPGSAVAILKLIAGRLRDLSTRNEELLAENISLQDGSRVEDYKRRIAHLEFQLDLLKRRYGMDEAALRQGIDVFGASRKGDDFLSNFNSSNNFTLFSFAGTRIQKLNDVFSITFGLRRPRFRLAAFFVRI